MAMIILVSLGVWQLQRLEWKRQLIENVETRLDAAPIDFHIAMARADAGENMRYTPVKLKGRFVDNKTASVFGAYDGKPGEYVFAPFETANGSFVYVNQGFTPQEVLRKGAAAPHSSEASIEEVIGLFRYAEKPAPPASWFRSTEPLADGLWFVRDPILFAEKAVIETVPYYVDSFAVKGRAWPKGGTTRLDFRNKHLEYALTWFGMGAALVGVWLAFSLQNPTKTNNFKK